MQGLVNTLAVLNKLSHYHAWLFEQYAHALSGDVLDIGSGVGDLVQFYHCRKELKSVVASDCSEHMLAALQERFKDVPRFAVCRLDILSGDDVKALGWGRFDVVTCINVLEHMDDDDKALEHMACLLRSSGTLCLIVPAFDWLYGSLDELVGHRRRYSRRVLFPKLIKAGFSVDKFHYMNMPGVLTWFLAGRILRRKTFPQGTCLALDRMVPFLRQIERFFHPPFGQSLVVFAKRGSGFYGQNKA